MFIINDYLNDMWKYVFVLQVFVLSFIDVVYGFELIYDGKLSSYYWNKVEESRLFLLYFTSV